MAENKRGLDVDVSEAIIGLKALSREAKEATKALKEYESTAQRLKAHMDANGAEYYAGVREATTKALAVHSVENTSDWRGLAMSNPKLDALLAGITDENRHADTEEPIDYIQRSYD